MVIAFFFEWDPFRYNGGEVKGFLGRRECGGCVELPHVRVALQIPVCLCVYVDLLPPSPLLQSSNLRCMAMAFFFSWSLSGTMGGKLRVFWEGGSVGVV